MLTVQAHAKINWALDVVGLRADGYHLLDMLMQSISLHDTLTLEKAEDVTLTVNGSPDPLGEKNLVVRAARLLQKETGYVGGVRMDLTKRIPSRAGLGGGSADCAAAMRALNELWQLRLSRERLLSLGLALGADVPFCLTGGLQRVRGIGEDLTALPAPEMAHLVLLMPDGGLDTRAVFRDYDASARTLPPVDMQRAQDALVRGDYAALNEYAQNALAGPAMRMSGAIEAAIRALCAQGAQMARMSGSGSAVFGVFASRAAAENACQALAGRYAFCEVVSTWRQGVNGV